MGLSLPEPPTRPSLWLDLGLKIDELGYDIGFDGAWKADIRDFDPEVVFHLAAKPIVAEGYKDPVGTFQTNVVGVGRVLEALTELPGTRAVVIITTDKVYSSNQSHPFSEESVLGGTDPYSASKASAELLVASWPGSPSLMGTARAGNVVGGGDWVSHRLIPHLVSAWEAGEPALLRDPEGIRPWQHVLEPLRGYLLFAEAIMANKSVSRALNFGPSPKDMISVQSIVTYCAEVWQHLGNVGSVAWDHLPNAPYPETHQLTLDSSRAQSELSWRGELSWRDTIELTINWYRLYIDGVQALKLVEDDIANYCELVEARG